MRQRQIDLDKFMGTNPETKYGGGGGGDSLTDMREEALRLARDNGKATMQLYTAVMRGNSSTIQKIINDLKNGGDGFGYLGGTSGASSVGANYTNTANTYQNTTIPTIPTANNNTSQTNNTNQISVTMVDPTKVSPAQKAYIEQFMINTLRQV